MILCYFMYLHYYVSRDILLFLLKGKPELDTHDENCTAGR